MQKSIRFPDDVARDIEAQAQKLDRSFSWVVVNAVWLHFRTQETLAKADARSSKAPSLRDTWAR